MRLLIFCLIVLIVSCYKDSNKKIVDDVYARVGSIELTEEDLVFSNNKTSDLRGSQIYTYTEGIEFLLKQNYD